MTADILATICAAAGWRWDPSTSQVEVALADGRKQQVRAEAKTLDGAEFLRLTSAIGPSDALDRQRSQAALRLNAELCYGAFAIIDDELAVVDLVPISAGCEVSLEASLRYVAQTADRYEQVVFETDSH